MVEKILMPLTSFVKGLTDETTACKDCYHSGGGREKSERSRETFRGRVENKCGDIDNYGFAEYLLAQCIGCDYSSPRIAERVGTILDEGYISIEV